jgi:anti-anti-sigma regulatory factor
MEFESKIFEKDDLLVITLKGNITRECKNHLQQCLDEALKFEQKVVVLILKELTGVDKIMSRDITLFQQQLRNKNKGLFLVGLKPQMKYDLDSRGLIRSSEVKNTAEEIITSRI